MRLVAQLEPHHPPQRAACTRLRHQLGSCFCPLGPCTEAAGTCPTCCRRTHSLHVEHDAEVSKALRRHGTACEQHGPPVHAARAPGGVCELALRPPPPPLLCACKTVERSSPSAAPPSSSTDHPRPLASVAAPHRFPLRHRHRSRLVPIPLSRAMYTQQVQWLGWAALAMVLPASCVGVGRATASRRIKQCRNLHQCASFGAHALGVRACHGLYSWHVSRHRALE